MTDPYAFSEELPVEPVEPGTTVLVAGPVHTGPRQVALRLLGGAEGEGAIIVATNDSAERVLEDCASTEGRFDLTQVGIVSCVEETPDGEFPARVLTVASPGDLTGIGMRYSKLYQDFHGEGTERVRTGLFSVSALLTFGDLQTVSRFVHTLAGRVDSVDGFGAFLVDPTAHDQRAVSTIGQFCDGRIDVRAGDDGTELRVQGLPDQATGWQSVDLDG